ncbi:hypothetical protein [Microbacterium sp. B19]|uniref:hypothetical protein n=1 Tax=Microbacterium sp. B19 TaxID=96765 RepID=UPI001EFA0340|nr:hypothetical protein [Microbacterium sp. B19]
MFVYLGAEMARRRGFFAELQHQAKLADQRAQAAARQHSKQVDAARRAAERAALAAARASEQDRKRLEREAAQAHAEARLAEADELTAEATERFQILDQLLSATLAIDDFVDLESLRAVAHHPPFPREDLRVPIPAPAPIPDPPLPVKREPVAVTGMFGRKQKAADALAAVERQYAHDYSEWKTATEELPARRSAQSAAYAAAEDARQAALAQATARYQTESVERERLVTEQNESLDQLIAGLAYGTVDAVQEYVGIVLANSVYPEWFPVSHTATFEPTSAELSLRVVMPGPDAVPTVKAYRYTKTTDEITPVAATQKETKDRYARAVHNIALRSIHEVFEADRRRLVLSISLELGTETVSPATGKPTYVPLVAVAVRRDEFEALDLSAVVPSATLEHLGASVSKNPHGLVPAVAGGVRRAR